MKRHKELLYANRHAVTTQNHQAMRAMVNTDKYSVKGYRRKRELASRACTRANTDGNGTDREGRRNGAVSIGNRTSVTAPALSTAEAPLPSSVCQAAHRRLERPCLSPPLGQWPDFTGVVRTGREARAIKRRLDGRCTDI